MQVKAASDSAAMRRIRDAARRLAQPRLARHALARLVPALRRARPGGLPPARSAAGAFDWDAPEAKNRSRCFLEVSVDGQRAGRLVVELLDELLPETSENFRLLCSGDAPSGASYVAIDVRAPGREGRGLAGRRPRGRARRLAQRVRGPAALRGRGLLRAARGARAADDGERGRRRQRVAVLCYCRTGAAPRRAMRRVRPARRGGPNVVRHLHAFKPLHAARVPVERLMSCGRVGSSSMDRYFLLVAVLEQWASGEDRSPLDHRPTSFSAFSLGAPQNIDHCRVVQQITINYVARSRRPAPVRCDLHPGIAGALQQQKARRRPENRASLEP